MAASMTTAGITTAGIPGQFAATRAYAADVLAKKRRISPQAGRALEVLGHAIEYLADEFVDEGGSFSAKDPRVEAIQLLMAINREIYLECPEVPGLRQRIADFMRR